MRIMELKILPPLLALILAAAMWGISKTTDFASVESELTSVLSVILLIIGLLVDVSAIVMFRRANTTVNPMKPGNAVQLVHGGIYNRSRNPMYLASLVMLLAWGIWLGSTASLVVLPFFVWYMTRFQILPEERALAKLFSDEYEDYKSRVNRWV
ncbi:Putative protein-S-isoprenylcysteine methyltransferase [hydrothermal vent metagenome]|uniref:Protein-S-isoprenylcysteine methyltransferase n=1 Tax=hydrothermal vent metagenome TaxID=652676 RepID=A0A3B0YJ18_9ZZZZ